MKTKRFCKSTVSLILAVMMLVSMFTVSIVNTSAAETDVAETGATKTYYFGVTSWVSIDYIHVWNSSSNTDINSSNFTKTSNTVTATVGSASSQTYTVYSVSVDSAYTGVKVYFNHSDGRQFETGDYTLATDKIILMTEWSGGSQHAQIAYSGGGGSSTTATSYLAGSFNSWNATADKFDSNNKVTKTLTANTTYTFKVVKDGTWLGNTGTISASVTGWTFNENTDNCTLNTTYAGDYVFTFDASTNKLSVTFPSAPATEPTTPDDGTTTTIYFKDGVTSWEIEGEDAKFFAKGNDGVVHEMKETVDTISGKPLWYAEDVASSNTTFTFYRTSYFFDESNATSGAWNTWDVSTARGSNTCYNATGTGTGSWSSTTIKPANLDSLDNFWYGLWVDTKNNLNTKTFVRAEVDGTNMALYLPSYVDLSNIQLYSSFKTSTIKGGAYSTAKSLAQGAPTTVALQTGVSYTVATTNDNNSVVNFTLKVYTTSDTASLLFTTKEELYTGLTSALFNANAKPSGSGIDDENDVVNTYKDAIETKGSYYLYGEDGAWVNAPTTKDGETVDMTVLKKIKGRGNSTFKASMQIYGKYAYNFNLDQKIDLTQRTDGSNASTASKKWCLLANNPDLTMMRNTFIYSLADDIGLKYGPETRLVDVYDNGKYLGAYIITEKVEYGKNTLMSDMKNLDDGNTDANSVFTADGEDYLYEFDTDDLNAGTEKTSAFSGTNYTYKYYTTYDRPAYKDESGNTVAAASNLTYNSPADYNTKYNYLLEFELYDRYQNEASWFKSSRTGQAVVVKYPEFATQEEMEWIISEYEKAESAIYDNNSDFTKMDAAIDVDSFARMYLIQELAINLDSCATSYYIHNDQATDKLVASPVWDYDWSMGAYMNTTNSGKKYVYNGSSVSVNSTTLDNPKQMFVKNKALKTDEDDNTKTANYNFQAKIVQNSTAWERCQYYWTNLFVPNLERYLDNDYTDSTSQKDDGVTEGRMLSEWLPRFESSLVMNDARWGSISFTGDNWGTKITSNYDPRSFSFGTGTSNAGSETKSYSNAVYYLNDWLVERWNYMSSSSGGNLYNEDLKETITADNADFTAVQDGDQLKISASVEITYNGERQDGLYPDKITYDIYVNGKLVDSNTLDQSTTITLESGIESNIYIKAYLTNAPNTYATSETQKFSYGISEYKVENVKFDAEQHDGVITVTPHATVTKEGATVHDPNLIEYTVYLNGEAVVTKTFAQGSANVTIPEGKTSEIYIKVNPAGVTTISGTSAKQTFSYGLPKVAATLYFKSSSSLRYAPKIVINKEEVSMTKTGNAIGKNASQTQSYYWYTATINFDKDVATTIAFKNEYSMYASKSLKLSADQTFYFAVDNLNTGSELVDLTKYNTGEDADELILNFKQSASHMVWNEATDPELATTSINGKIKKVGDATDDNALNINDATAIQRSLAEIAPLSDMGQTLSDFNLDSTTSIMDVTNIQIKLAN